MRPVAFLRVLPAVASTLPCQVASAPAAVGSRFRLRRPPALCGGGKRQSRSASSHDASAEATPALDSASQGQSAADRVGLLLAPPPTRSTQEARSSWHRLKIVTGGDPVVVADPHAQMVIENQRSFAWRQGYAYEVHVGNYASPWIAYWHKIDVLLRELRMAKPSEVLVWMDLDMLITDPTQGMLERILDAYPKKAVILTEDAQQGDSVPGVKSAKRRVNTGIILVRCDPIAIRVLEQLFEYGRQHRDAAYLPQSKDTLHEQDAFNSLLGGSRGHVWSRHVAVIPQRSGSLNLNTFARNAYDGRYNDPVSVEWSAGDFTAHCTGLRKQHREWCIVDALSAADASVSAVDGCPNSTSTSPGPQLDIGSFAKTQPSIGFIV